MYPVRNGIPLLLSPQSADRLSHLKQTAENIQVRSRLARYPLLEKLAHFLRPPHPFLDPAGNVQRARMGAILLEKFSQPAILDIGSGLDSKNLEGLPLSLRPRCACLDIRPAPGVSVAADGHELPFSGESFEGILLQGVLEHVPEPYQLIREAYRVLKPGGLIYVEVPFLQHFHYSPDDFYRYTLHGLEHILRDFRKIEDGVLSGPGSALCDFLTEAPAAFFRSSLIYWGIKWVGGWLTLPLKYLDWFYRVPERAHMMSGALFFLGAKEE
ncbi:MAG: methyltransferase domain-containing protein [Elusimicrobia bacterium]|nr:methyltransferase domain-containing protein [Elusimicrobiota bacterium]